MKRLAIILLLTFVSLSGYTQNHGAQRERQLSTLKTETRIDTLSLIPGSLSVYQDGILIPDTMYYVDYAKSTVSPMPGKVFTNVTVTYKSFPYNFMEPVQHKSISLIGRYTEKSQRKQVFVINNNTEEESGYSELDRRGSISRGISFGNNQDVIVNSNLNLQLSGKISDNLYVLAAITDNNIPIQPDGNSQQIQEFDKVFIQVYNDKNKLIVGDYELNKPVGTFLKMNKKLQGAYYAGLFDLNKERKTSYKPTISGAVAKGKYCRQEIDGMEGNQGPYKISGCSGESYIIVLAGSERVYIDGRLMTRGLENDYVIDYNTAELTFTPNQIISKDKRIVVEFEYSERSYTRFMVFNNNEFKTRNGSLWFSVYSEQDGKNQPVNQLLSDEQKRILADVGDSLNLAVVPNIQDTLFSSSIIMYKKTDTLLADGSFYDSIYMYSTDPDSAHYKLGFSYVGENKGSYTPLKTTANGKVYKWVAPVGGILQGSYEPVVLLVTPKKKQMVSTGGLFTLGRYTRAQYEFSLTNNDINTFSQANRSDNIGYGLHLKIDQRIPIGDTSQIRFNTKAEYQFTDRFFDPVERFRSAEFERDWNLQNAERANEHLMGLGVVFTHRDLSSAEYSGNYLVRDSYSAIRNSVRGVLLHKGFNASFSGSLLSSNSSMNETRFIRQQGEVSQKIWKARIGFNDEIEHNQWKAGETDSLLANSFSFRQFGVFIKSEDTTGLVTNVFYKNRKDFLPLDNDLRFTTLGEDIGASMAYSGKRNNRIKTTLNYRRLSIADTLLTDLNQENTITGRLEYNLSLFRGSFISSTFYEIGSGLEAEKEYSYVKVAKGQGVFKWDDYNANGVEDLDEFEVAVFQDEAEYIRVFIPTNNYVKTYVNQFNQLLNINPARIWNDKTGIRRTAARFSNQFAYRMNRKNRQDNLFLNANPIGTSVEDSNLVSLASSIRNTLSFNKTGRVFGMDYIYQNSTNRMLMVNGIDTRNHLSNGLRLRWSIGSKYTVLNTFNKGVKSNSSEYFVSRNYTIPYTSNESGFTFQPLLFFRIGVNYKYTAKSNIAEMQNSTEHKAGIELKYNIASKGNIAVSVDYIKLDFDGDPNTSTGYEMLQGLLPGNNGTWSVVIQQSISKNLHLNLTYNGRITENAPAVHVGGVQLRASF